jgi:hypothetical protein
MKITVTPPDYEGFVADNTIIWTVFPTVTPDICRVTYRVVDGETFIPPGCQLLVTSVSDEGTREFREHHTSTARSGICPVPTFI